MLLNSIFLNTSSMAAESSCDTTRLNHYIQETTRLYYQDNLDKAYFLLDSILSNTNKDDYTRCPELINIKATQGFVLEAMMDYENSLLAYKEVIKMSMKTNNHLMEAKGYIYAATSHELVGRKDDCRRNLNRAKMLINAYNLSSLLPLYHVRMASYYRQFVSQDSAHINADQAVYYSKIFNDIQNLADGYLLKGSLSSDSALAIGYFKQSLEQFKKIKYTKSLAFQYLNIAYIYAKVNHPKQSLLYIDSSFVYGATLFNSRDKYYIFASGHRLKSKIYERQNDTKLALIELNKSSTYNDSIYMTYHFKSLSATEIEIAILEEKLNIETAKKQKTYWIIGTFSFTLISILLGFVLNKMKHQKSIIESTVSELKTKNKALDQALQNYTMLISEVHHRVKNNLQLIISILIIKAKKVANYDISNHFDDINNKIRTISLIHEQLYLSNKFDAVNFNSYVSELVGYFNSLKKNSGDKFLIQIDPNLFFNLETLLPLGLIISELISNSMKYAQEKKKSLVIKISIQDMGDIYNLHFSDNGPGKQNVKEGLGSILIQSMVRQLNAEFKEFNKNGYHFSLTFKIKSISNVV